MFLFLFEGFCILNKSEEIGGLQIAWETHLFQFMQLVVEYVTDVYVAMKLGEQGIQVRATESKAVLLLLLQSVAMQEDST